MGVTVREPVIVEYVAATAEAHVAEVEGRRTRQQGDRAWDAYVAATLPERVEGQKRLGALGLPPVDLGRGQKRSTP